MNASTAAFSATVTTAVTAPCAVYEVDGRSYAVDSREFANVVAQAQACRRRLRCMCQAGGVEMYVARLAPAQGGYIVKRMPDTGWRHATHCPSYAPPAATSGLGQLLGSAILEDPANGVTTLKLGFALSRMQGRVVAPTSEGSGTSVRSDGATLSLRGLLHYLWDQAELARWHPDLAGKRSWGVVRSHLLEAAGQLVARRELLVSRLYIPEPFSVDQREALYARRLAAWSCAAAERAGCAALMLLIAEVKEIVPARYGFKAVVKHLPDQAFMIDESLYRRLGRAFETELALWATGEDVHMIMIATFGVSGGVPSVQELCLMPVTRQWLPVDDGFGKQLVDKLVAQRRAFTRSLPYELPAKVQRAFAVLSDCGNLPATLSIVRGDQAPPDAGAADTDAVAPGWLWHAHLEPLPALPARASADAGDAARDQEAAGGMAPVPVLRDFGPDAGRTGSPAGGSGAGSTP
ncbi:DUF1173 domain-containing protein [Pelomonas sp. Root1217]|uniref:DUF1173 domain-containing protein n=1 Tax=Pelomonas sp. Root1217 TaxID=1736430 RepID=UPI0009E85280|nr:DUF1173 domain-containing protein [Pelomonas sp. Root1217]